MPDLSIQEFNDLVSNAFKIPNFSLSPLPSFQQTRPPTQQQKHPHSPFSRSSVLFSSRVARSDSRLDAYTDPRSGLTSFIDPNDSIESPSRFASFTPPWLRRRNSDVQQNTDNVDSMSNGSSTLGKSSGLSSIFALKSRPRPLLRRKSSVLNLRNENTVADGHMSFFDDSGYNEEKLLTSPTPSRKLSPPAIPRSRSKPQLRSFLPLPPTPKTAKSVPSSPSRMAESLPSTSFSTFAENLNKMAQSASASNLSLNSKRQLPPYPYPPPPYPSPTSPLPPTPHISMPRPLQPHHHHHHRAPKHGLGIASSPSTSPDAKPLKSLQQRIQLKSLPAKLRKVASSTLAIGREDGSVDSDEILSWRNGPNTLLLGDKDPMESPSPISIRNRLGLGPRVRTDPGLRTTRKKQQQSTNKTPPNIRTSRSAAALLVSKRDFSPQSSESFGSHPSPHTYASASTSALSLNSTAATMTTMNTNTNSSSLSSAEKRRSFILDSRRSVRLNTRRRNSKKQEDTEEGTEGEEILTLGRVLTPDVDPFAASPSSPTSFFSPQSVPKSPLSPTSSLLLNSPISTRSSLPPSLLNALGPSYPYCSLKEPITPPSDFHHHGFRMHEHARMPRVPESVRSTPSSLSSPERDGRLSRSKKEKEEKPTHSTSTSVSSITVTSGVPGHTNSRPHSPFPLLFLGPSKRGHVARKVSHGRTGSSSSSLGSGIARGLATLHRSGSNSNSRVPTPAPIIMQTSTLAPLDRVGEDNEDVANTSEMNDSMASSTAWYLAARGLEINTLRNSSEVQSDEVPMGLGLLFDSGLEQKCNGDRREECADTASSNSTEGRRSTGERPWPLPPKRTVVVDEENSSGWHDVDPSVQFVPLNSNLSPALRNRHSIRFPSSSALPSPVSPIAVERTPVSLRTTVALPPSPTSPTSRILSKQQARAIAQQFTPRARVTSDSSNKTAAGTSSRSAYYTASESPSGSASMSSCIPSPISSSIRLPKLTTAFESPPASPLDGSMGSSIAHSTYFTPLGSAQVEVYLGSSVLINLPPRISLTDPTEVLSLSAVEWPDLVAFCSMNDSVIDLELVVDKRRGLLYVTLLEVTSAAMGGRKRDTVERRIKMALSSVPLGHSDRQDCRNYHERVLSNFTVTIPARLEDIVAIGGRISIGTGVDQDEIPLYSVPDSR